MISPSNNPITLPFGSTASPYSASNPHKGTDFSYLPDKTIYMPVDATVTLVPNNGNDGNGVYFTAEGLQVGLLHTSKYLVNSGQFVKQGTPVAIMGDTGLAQGVHLHFAVKKNGVFVNPMDYVSKQEEEPMFNDGDRKNWLTEAYVQDVGQYSELVGKVSYKEAIEKMRTDGLLRTNPGDVTNGFAIFGRKPSPDDLAGWTKQPFKKFQYEKIADGVAKMPSKGLTPYNGKPLFTEN